MKSLLQRLILVSLLSAFCGLSGCNFIPDVRHKPQYHNPFPQIRTVAILPFRNQSESPTLSGERVSLAYSHELQLVPGFEVLPVGAVRNQLLVFEQQQLRHPLASSEDFQAFASYLGVDAVIQGAVTDFDPYYPPRMTLKTNWYTANPNFHEVPVGYGLPWGTKHEKQIPDWVRLEAERELAAEQLVSQTPMETNVSPIPQSPPIHQEKNPQAESHEKNSLKPTSEGSIASKQEPTVVGTSIATADSHSQSTNESAPTKRKSSADVFKLASDQDVQRDAASMTEERLSEQTNALNSIDAQSEINTTEDMIALEPTATNENSDTFAVESSTVWPDPQGFIPPLPSTTPPQPIKFAGPVISHMAAYNGTDEDFTSELEEYYYFRDDGRFGGWESYLQRSEDFIRFCSYLHIKETLVSRGGQLKNRTVVRWPFSRYHER